MACEPRHFASRGSPQPLGARRARIATADREPLRFVRARSAYYRRAGVASAAERKGSPDSLRHPVRPDATAASKGVSGLGRSDGARSGCHRFFNGFVGVGSERRAAQAAEDDPVLVDDDARVPVARLYPFPDVREPVGERAGGHVFVRNISGKALTAACAIGRGPLMADASCGWRWNSDTPARSARRRCSKYAPANFTPVV